MWASTNTGKTNTASQTKQGRCLKNGLTVFQQVLNASAGLVWTVIEVYLYWISPGSLSPPAGISSEGGLNCPKTAGRSILGVNAHPSPWRWDLYRSMDGQPDDYIICLESLWSQNNCLDRIWSRNSLYILLMTACFFSSYDIAVIYEIDCFKSANCYSCYKSATQESIALLHLLLPWTRKSK